MSSKKDLSTSGRPSIRPSLIRWSLVAVQSMMRILDCRLSTVVSHVRICVCQSYWCFCMYVVHPYREVVGFEVVVVKQE